MRVLVDVNALEALCSAAESKFSQLVTAVRSSVRAEPKAEAISKVSIYPEPGLEEVVSPAVTFTPRKRSVTE